MTARTSPHYPAVLRARLLRRRAIHEAINDGQDHYVGAEIKFSWCDEARFIPSSLVDAPLTEEQKAARWEGIWKR